MLETLWLRLEIENRYLSMFLFSLLFSFAVLYFTKTFIPLPTGISSVFLISLAAAYPFVRYMKHEEESESKMQKRLSEKSLLKRHEKELLLYVAFFLGVIITFIISSFVFGTNSFEAQLESISGMQNIRGYVTQNTIGFSEVFLNNLTVFSITFLISLMISAGMVFILVWNASVLGVFIASNSENAIMAHVNILPYLPHGIIEIAGYIMAGIAASLLSYQLERKIRGKNYAKGVFSQVLADVFLLVVIGIGLLIIGATIEVL